MIRRATGASRIDAGEAKFAQIQHLDERIDHANRIALFDPVIQAFRQQRRLPPIRPHNKAPHRCPRRFSAENYSRLKVFTQPGSKGDLRAWPIYVCSCPDCGHRPALEILPQALEEGMADLSLGRFCAVFDFREQLRLHPDALVRDPLGVGLRFADQRREALAQFGR